MIGYLTDPFQYPFMQRALEEVLLLSIPAGLLGISSDLRVPVVAVPDGPVRPRDARSP